MNAKNDVDEICLFLENLLKEIRSPTKDAEAFSFVENIISREVPSEIKAILDGNMEMHDAFGAWVFSTPSMLRLEYSAMMEAPTDNYSFFNSLEIDSNFELKKERELSYDDVRDFPGRYKIGEKITNLISFVPIARASNSVLLVNTSSEAYGELLTCYCGVEVFVYAPNIESHLLDLVDGLRSGRYPIEDGYIGIGDSWLEREQSKDENMPFNIDGELIKG